MASSSFFFFLLFYYLFQQRGQCPYPHDYLHIQLLNCASSSSWATSWAALLEGLCLLQLMSSYSLESPFSLQKPNGFNLSEKVRLPILTCICRLCFCEEVSPDSYLFAEQVCSLLLISPVLMRSPVHFAIHQSWEARPGKNIVWSFRLSVRVQLLVMDLLKGVVHKDSLQKIISSAGHFLCPLISSLIRSTVKI